MGAYTFVAAGSFSAAGNPGAPAGAAAGQLALCRASARGQAETINAAPAGWTLLLDTSTTVKEQLAVFGRIFDGGANDAISSHDFWSGTSSNACQIACWSGDVHTNLGTIVAHSSVEGSTGAAADLPYPALTVSTDNCLIIAVGCKVKTVTSDGLGFNNPAELGTRIGINANNGSVTADIWAYNQQTTATSIAGGIWNQTVEESEGYSSLVLALKSLTATIAPKATYYQKMRNR